MDIEAENAALKQRIQELEAELVCARAAAAPPPPPPAPSEPGEQKWDLELDEYKRYGRQMVMPEVGLEGQLRLKRAKVLIVGVGGLGCPAAAYLAGAGVGTIGLIDHDVVEASNLHRQILHSTARVGAPKVESALLYLHGLNPYPNYIAHPFALSPSNALSILAAYDLILDCTDHPSLRYLISDTAILASRSVVSASALRKDGQLILLNSPPGHGPCYRCIWPHPPPEPASCTDAGILGPVVGTMGVLQALEAIKLLVRGPPAAAATTMTLFSAWPDLAFRHVRMRARRAACIGCASVRGALAAKDYSRACAPVRGLAPEERVTAREYRELRLQGEEGVRHVLLDVRDRTQFGICHLRGSCNVPFEDLDGAVGLPAEVRDAEAVYVICRLGNDSQAAVHMLKEAGVAGGRVWDVKGGIREWARTAPEGFPEY